MKLLPDQICCILQRSMVRMQHINSLYSEQMLLALQVQNVIATWRAHCLRINCAARLTHVVLLVVRAVGACSCILLYSCGASARTKGHVYKHDCITSCYVCEVQACTCMLFSSIEVEAQEASTQHSLCAALTYNG